MMHHYVWMITNTDLQDHLRRANEERAAAIYGLFRGTGTVISWAVRSIIGALHWAQRRRRTVTELSKLSDRSLQDIGLTREEIGLVAAMAAKADPETKLTIAALHRLEHTGPTDSTVPFPLRRRRDVARSHGFRRPLRQYDLDQVEGSLHRAQNAPISLSAPSRRDSPREVPAINGMRQNL